MQITTITVHAGRVLPHPFKSYANLRPELSITATLDPGEDPQAAMRDLQALAEQRIEDHSRSLIQSLEECEQIRRDTEELASLERQIARAQAQIDEARSRTESLRGSALPAIGDTKPAPAGPNRTDTTPPDFDYFLDEDDDEDGDPDTL